MTPALIFRDRTDAGEQLASAIYRIVLQTRADGVTAPLIVYALPRGGLPVALPIAQLLGCPLDIVVAKKISHPQNPELAIGAVTARGNTLWASHTPFNRKKHNSQRQAAVTAAREQAQLQLARLAPGSPRATPQGAIAILVDDGIATGMTIAVAAQDLRAQNAVAVWICAPVAPMGLLPWLQQWSDRVILLDTPETFLSVSRFYQDFPQVETETALTYMQQQIDWLKE